MRPSVVRRGGGVSVFLLRSAFSAPSKTLKHKPLYALNLNPKPESNDAAVGASWVGSHGRHRRYQRLSPALGFRVYTLKDSGL